MTATATTTHPLALVAIACNRTNARDRAAVAGMKKAEAERLWVEAHAKRTARTAARRVYDVVLARRPGSFATLYMGRKVRRAYETCVYRHTTHGHEWSWDTSTYAHVDSDVTYTSPSSVDSIRHPNAYTGYSVACSSHHVVVSPTWLRDVHVRGLSVLDGLMTLACSQEPDLSVRPDGCAYQAAWVRQGRGTSLITERGWLVRVAGSWTHARTIRAARAVGGASRGQTAGAWKGDLDIALAENPIVRYTDARAAGLCVPGIRDWCERHTGGSTRGIRARDLWALAQRASDRTHLVERAIRQAYGRVCALAAA